MRQVVENDSFPPLCGCSSMVEQKLPKLQSSPKISTKLSKKRAERFVLNQSLSFARQNTFGAISLALRPLTPGAAA